MTYSKIFILLFILSFMGACGNSDTTDNSISSETSEHTEKNESDDEITADDGSVITKEVLDKACGCVISAKANSVDLSAIIQSVKSCMGGNSQDFINKLMGEGASEKEKNDALIDLKTKMEKKCPLQ